MGPDGQRRLVAHAAAGVLVHDDDARHDVVEIQLVAAGRHGQREVGGLLVGHALEEDGHGPGRHLIIGDAPLGEALDEEIDFGGGKLAAVTLFDDDVDWVHGLETIARN